MKKNDMVIERVIQRCGCDKILPLCVVYIFYIIMHGHLSPGGGFQGAILTVAAVILIYLAHGYKATKALLRPNFMHNVEGLALILYIFIAAAGIAAGSQFCSNYFADKGPIGALFSSGSIFCMNAAVGIDVLAGSVVITIGMMSVLFPQDIDSLE